MANRKLPANVYVMKKKDDAEGIRAFAVKQYGLHLGEKQTSDELVKELADFKHARQERQELEVQAQQEQNAKVEQEVRARMAGETVSPPVPQPPASAIPPAIQSQGGAVPPIVPPATVLPGSGQVVSALPAPGQRTATELMPVHYPAQQNAPAAPSPPGSGIAIPAHGTQLPIQPAVGGADWSPGAQADVEGAAPPAPVLIEPSDPDKPLDPYAARGFKPGSTAAKAKFYDEKGNPLKPDSNPVLPEHIATSDYQEDYNADGVDPFLQGAFGSPGRTANSRIQHGPERGIKKFRHPQHTLFFLNNKTMMAYRPTEITMRREALIPWFQEALPEGYTFGG